MHETFLRESRKRVTFGHVKVTYVPRRCGAASHRPFVTADSSTLAEPTPLASHTEEASESESVATATPDSGSSLLLTQTALGTSFLSGEGNDVLSTLFENEKDEQETHGAADTHLDTLVAQAPVPLGAEYCQNVCPPPLYEAALSDYASRELGVLKETPLLSGLDLKLILPKKRSLEKKKLTVAAACSTRCRLEKAMGAASSVTCIFCHEDVGVIVCYSGQHLHLACALWCPEVYYDKEEATLKNVDRALERSRFIKCAYCRRPGAPIGCVNKQCQRSYHLRCALHVGAQLNEKNFELFCPRHGKKGLGIYRQLDLSAL